MVLEHRLTTIEVTLRNGLDEIKTLGRANGEAAKENTFALNALVDRVGVQNGRISKIETKLIELAPIVDAIAAESTQTHAVVGFIKGAGGVGNALILTAVALFGSVLVGFQIFHFVR